MSAFFRTCQECGHVQRAKQPDLKNDRWRDLKCNRCKSEAMDFGSEMEVDAVGRPIETQWTVDDA